MSVWSRVRNVFGGDAVNEEISEEMESHVREGVAAGREEREVRRAMGRVMTAREESHAMRVVGWMDSLRADVVFGWRQLWKRKVTTAAAVLSLGLALGACMAAFRLVDALFLRPLPIAHPERLYEIQYRGVDETGKPTVDDGNDYAQFLAMRSAVKGQADLVADSDEGQTDLNFGGDKETEKVELQDVSGGLFATFGLQPVVGRLLSEEDDRVPGASPYAVISYDYWARRLGRDPRVVGRTFHMNNRVYEIVGVAPKGFSGMEPGAMADVFAPLTMKPDISRLDAEWLQWLRVYADVLPGTDMEALRGKLDVVHRLSRLAVWKEVSKHLPNPSKDAEEGFLNWKVMFVKGGHGVSEMQDELGAPLVALSVLVGLVLLIACANVANLTAGQVSARAREMAVRVSLGAGRGRLARLVMVEGAMVGSVAATLGSLFAWWAAPSVLGRISHVIDMRLALDLRPDWMVMGFGVALTVGVTVLFGLIPTVHASRTEPASAMKGGSEPRGSMKWMHGMVAAQVAFCFVVLFSAALFVGTLERLKTKPVGFSAERILLVSGSPQHPEPLAKWEQAAERLRMVPGVERVSLAGGVLLDGSVTTTFISVNGAPAANVRAYTRHITPGLLETMQIPLLAGRDFTRNDTNPGQALVNEEFARQYFGGANPVGKHFSFAVDGDGPLDKQGGFEVIGLVRNTLYDDLRGTPPPTAYLPMHGAGSNGEASPLLYGVFVIKTKGAPMAMAETLRKALEQSMPELALVGEQTQQEVIDRQTFKESLLAGLGGFFAVVALLLAVVGLYGVLHYSVVQRERELGIRIALGAAAGNIARIVSARVFAMVLLGAAVGLVLGVGSERYVQSLLYGVKGTDVSMMVLPAAVLLFAAVLAAAPAVLRAVKIDPAVMLRSE